MLKLIGLGLWDEKSSWSAFLLEHYELALAKNLGKKVAVGANLQHYCRQKIGKRNA